MNYRQITSVMTEGLSYRNKQGKVVSIGFEHCANNYQNFVLTSEEFNIENPVDYKQETPKCVGWRDVNAKPPFIEFFAQPRVKFEFRATLVTWDSQKKFLELQNNISALGWTTFDLS